MGGTVFADRSAAGRALGAALAASPAVAPGTLVLAIPRGGVVVAAEVAKALGSPLDVALARKVGAPGNPELAMGAVGPGGQEVIDTDVVARLGVDREHVARAVADSRAEVVERLERFRGGRPPLDVRGRAAIVVDDGLATGSTAAAVGRWLRAAGASHSMLAVPVGPRGTVARLRHEYDDVVTLAEPEPFFAVGEFYRDFRQVTDEEVRQLLG